MSTVDQERMVKQELVWCKMKFIVFFTFFALQFVCTMGTTYWFLTELHPRFAGVTVVLWLSAYVTLEYLVIPARAEVHEWLELKRVTGGRV